MRDAISCFLCLLVFSALAGAAQVYTVTLEEPTGLERRTAEVVAVPLERLGGHREGYTVADEAGRELPWQASDGYLFLPASVMPGKRPLLRIYCCDSRARAPFANPIVLRKVGLRRVEFGNEHFRAVIDTGRGAISDVYSLRTGPHRMLNYVETSPETAAALRGDIHETDRSARQGIQPIAGIEGDNDGWTSLGGQGEFTAVEFLETGPLRGRMRLARSGETWEITWYAGAANFRWKAARGFRFASISASPYLPFNRCVDGSEYDWPTGPGEEEPAPHDIALRGWTKLPGGHVVYYQREEDYGALGIVALDAALDWTGACTRRLLAQKAQGETEIAITFPRWKGGETVLEARRENRLLRHPLLVRVDAGVQGALPRLGVAPRQTVAQLRHPPRPASPWQPQELSLNGEWELAYADKGAGPPAKGWRAVRVPGTVHTQWLPSDQIYTRAAEWLSYKEWWYRRKFRLPASFAGKRIRLQFEATDYYAETYINGRFAGRHEGYIDPYELDVSNLVRSDQDNEIQVRVWTPVHYYWKHRPYTIKGAYGAVDQKPDDITATGITRPVRLVASSGGVIRDVAIATRLTETGAEVDAHLEADLQGEGYSWELTLAPRNFSSPQRYQIIAPASPHPTTLTIPVDDPQLWWTWDHGKPHLYTLDIRLLDAAGNAVDGNSLAVGIREIEKIGWNFYLNRRKMFIRGTNYYYHLYLSEMDRTKYQRDLELMLAMNVNMIRLHCHFTNPEFYELADERGVLLWQDFLEAWYPHDREFSQHAAALYDNHIRYVRNHPSIALWATSDEEDFENYRDLTKHLAPRAWWQDPQRRPVVRSTGRFGDAHVYYGWYGGSIWQYRFLTQEFVSELGATSLPNYETLIKFLPNHWPIQEHAAEWKWRKLQIPEALRAWGDPAGKSLAEYIPQTQAYVARLFQLAIERMRRRKKEGAGGILHFHAIDIWPSVTMAAIDFERVPTKTYHVVRRSFEPLAVLFDYERDRWRHGWKFECSLWAVNDLWQRVPEATVAWRIVNLSGDTQASGAYRLTFEPDAVEHLGVVEWMPAAPGKYELRAELRDQTGKRISENIYEFEVLAP